MNSKWVVAVFGLCIWLIACGKQEKPPKGTEAKSSRQVFTANDNIRSERSDLGLGLDRLSEYGFFSGELKELVPVGNVMPYDLNMPLFSDYAYKARFIKFPVGTSAAYDPQEVLDFPPGTILIKNFYYPDDMSDPEGARRIIETRLLLNKSGSWEALSYIWNDEQTEAYLEVAGGTVDVAWKHTDGQIRNVAYSIPNLNQCKNCHAFNNKIRPIGPTARQLNRSNDMVMAGQNQLAYMLDHDLLADAPHPDEWPQLASWASPDDQPLEARARAYLDINCGSCHRPEGSGNTSGLFLHYHEQHDAALGIGKSPVAAGRGSGGLKYDIYPGAPDQSILLYRMKSLDPGVMMPEMGRKLVHDEGVALIEAWIREMGD